MGTTDQQLDKRRRALAYVASHLDVVTEAGDAMREFQAECELTAIEAAEILWDVFDAQEVHAGPGSVVGKLEAADSGGSFPYARTEPYEADPYAPILDVGTVNVGNYTVPRLALGCMRLLSASGVKDGVPQTALGIPHSPEATRHALLTARDICGLRYFDVARGYGPWAGFAERMLVEWLSHPSEITLLASKVGYRREQSGSWFVDLDADFLAREVDDSVAQFNGSVPLLYLVARSTPTTPVVNRPHDIARTLEPLKKAMDDGRVQHVGVANVTVDELKILQSVAPIAAVQNRFTLSSLSDPQERAVFEFCREQKIPFVAWGLFGEGARSDDTTPLCIVEAARDAGISNEEMTLAVILSTGDNVLALPGPGRRQTIYSSVRGASYKLDDAMRESLLLELT